MARAPPGYTKAGRCRPALSSFRKILRGEPAAWRAALIYAVVGGAWLLAAGVATITAFREIL